MKLTLEERERWYYANGNLEAAEAITVAIDMQEELWDTVNQVDDWKTQYYQLGELYDELLKEKE